MEIIIRKISELKAAEYNPRKISKHDLEALTESIRKFGTVEPVIVNKFKGREDIIIGGHQRVKAAKSMGLTEIPTVELKLNEKQEQELNIRLNRNSGEWDFDKLAEFEFEDLKDWGFEDYELRFNPENKDKEIDENLKTETECPKCGYQW